MITILKLREHEELAEKAAQWFHQKWGVPPEAYMESIEECLCQKAVVPQWYLALEGHTVMGCPGVIENDFHNRRDLAPNVCAVYVEEGYLCRGIAVELLHTVCTDIKEQGVDTLYLVTDHTSFYERYGWEFFCMVQEDGEPTLSRMYVHRAA